MSRRPPLQAEESTPLGMSRMAPGGRLWSESPVRRPYPRVRQMGAAPPDVPPPTGLIRTAPEVHASAYHPFGSPTMSIQLPISHTYWENVVEDPPITALVITIATWHVESLTEPADADGPIPYRIADSGQFGDLRWGVLVVPYDPDTSPEFSMTATGDGATDATCMVWEHAWNGDPNTPMTVQAAAPTGTTCQWPAYPTGASWHSPAQFIASMNGVFPQETPAAVSDADPNSYSANPASGECANLSWLPEFTTTKTAGGSAQWLTLVWGWGYTPPTGKEQP